MLLNDPYIWAKALHVVAALLFVSGVLLAAVTLSAAPTETGGTVHPILRRVRRWDRQVTTPAMVATWALGLFLGTSGGWFASGWLIAKLAVVVALSGLHGLLSGRLRLAASGRPPRNLGWSPPVVAALAALIVTFAVTKI